MTFPQAKAADKRESAMGCESLRYGCLLYLAATQAWEASELKFAAIQNSEVT